MAADPWTAFLDWLGTVLVPSWGELIALLPIVVVGSIIGPIVTILVLMWLWYLLHRTGGRVHREEAQPVAAPLDDDGAAFFEPNTPYCEEHALIYPARATQCEIDRSDLSVICPVDGTVRDAAVQVCPACGTKYVLGATASSAVVTSSAGPPPGGAAVA
jgi:hypothetical protein